jgi:hypothetical protein
VTLDPRYTYHEHLVLVLRPCLALLVIAFLNKKIAQATPNWKLIFHYLRTHLHDASQIHRQASSGMRPASRGLCSGLASASLLMDEPHPRLGLALLLTLHWSCLTSPQLDPHWQLPSAPLRSAPPRFASAACRWAALGSPLSMAAWPRASTHPRLHAGLLTEASAFLPRACPEQGGAVGSGATGGEDDSFGLGRIGINSAKHLA